MAISINSQTPAQIASQDLTSGSSAQAAPGAQAGGVSAGADPAPQTGPSPSDQIAAHAGLVALASGASQSNGDGLVIPDLDGEGARLQALQLQQQLGTQTVSIANQAPQALLALLR